VITSYPPAGYLCPMRRRSSDRAHAFSRRFGLQVVEVRNAVRGISGAGQHVVPLEDLVQHDAVYEATEADAEPHGASGSRVVTAGPAGPGRSYRLAIGGAWRPS
jgi:hypothetical protein